MLFEVYVHNLFSFGYIDFVHIAGKFHGLSLAEGLLAGIVLRGNFQFVGRKKLLRFAAGFSAFAVIAPIDAGHVLLFIKMDRNECGQRLAESIILQTLPSTRSWQLGWRFWRQAQVHKSATLNLGLNLPISTAGPGAYVGGRGGWQRALLRGRSRGVAERGDAARAG